MKFRQVTEREGEYLGPVDWTYNFLDHFKNYGTTEQGKKELCDVAVERLKKISEGGKWLWSRSDFSAFEVVNVGMYDGWPYWKPTPAFSFIGPLGSLEWAFFYELADREPYQKKSETQEAKS